MNTLEIPTRGIYKQYAGSWEEIPLRHATYIGRCLYWMQMQEITVDMFRKLVVDRLINRVNSPNSPTEGEMAMNLWANEARLADTVNFFFRIHKDKQDPEKQMWEVLPNFVVNLIPRVRVGLRWYYGPGDFLTEMSFSEFKDLFVSAQKWMETKDTAYLERIMAIGYRPRRTFLFILKRLSSYNGLTRPRYNPNQVERRMKKMKRVDFGARYMFFEYLMGCLFMLKTDAQGQGIEIDGQMCQMSMIFGKKSQKEDDMDSQGEDIGMMGVIMALAETGVFGNLQQTSQADVWDVLSRLYQLELQAREFDRKMKK